MCSMHTPHVQATTRRDNNSNNTTANCLDWLVVCCCQFKIKCPSHAAPTSVDGGVCGRIPTTHQVCSCCRC